MNKLLIAALGVAVATTMLAGCNVERRKSDAELGLNQQQARGRVVYDRHCIRCHEPYSSREIQGPSLRGIFKKEQFPSGIKASDERMLDVIEIGKSKMPSFRNSLSQQQLEDLLAYLHTL